MNTDFLHKVLNWIDYNRWTILSLVLCAILFGGIVTTVGCQSKTIGLITSPQGDMAKVTRTEFNQQVITVQKDVAVKKATLDAEVSAYNEEVKAINAKIEAGLSDLDKQDEFKQQLLETVGTVATQAAGGNLNPASLIPIGIGLLGGALGLGAAADNRRKDQVISTLKQATGTA